MCLYVRNKNRINTWVMRLCLFACPMFVACSSQPEATDNAAEAVAKAYCDYLLRGQYRDYVMGRVDYDSLPSSYVEQLVANVKMMVRKQQRRHGGVKEIETEHADVDGDQALAYLLFHYDDGITKRVMVPLMRKGGLWYLR